MPRSKFIDVTDEDDDVAAGYARGEGIASQGSWATQITQATQATYATHGTYGTHDTAGGRSARSGIRQEITQQRQDLLRRLHETGEIDVIKTQLRSQLLECGWREEMRIAAQNAIRNGGGVAKITVDALVEELKPRSKAAVPENVKRTLLENVTDFVRRERGEVGPDGIELVLKPGMSLV